MLLLPEKKLLLVKVRDHTTAHRLGQNHNLSRDSRSSDDTVKISVESKDIRAALLAIELKKDYKTKENGIFHAVQDVSFLVKFSIETYNLYHTNSTLTAIIF